MFNKNFYPTPKDVIAKMLKPYMGQTRFDINLKSKGRTTYILDPEAGKADILDYIKEKTSKYANIKFRAIEINPDLQNIISGKGYQVIGSDFLDYKGSFSFDYIFMNPPFDKGAEHLLKAWSIARNSEIVCVLNAETYNNAYSQKRKELKSIIDKFGTVEEIGQAFKNAERKTNVECIIVRLKKETKHISFDPSDLDREFKKMPDKIESTGIEVRDELLSMEQRYSAAVDQFNKMSYEIAKFKYIASPLMEYPKQSIEQASDGFFNEFLEDINSKAWDLILSKTDFKNMLTKKTRDSFIEKFQTQKNLSFTKKNMLTLLEVLFSNRHEIMKECIIEIFDSLTKYHDGNREGVKGYKTNEEWVVGKRIVLPNMVKLGWSGQFQIDWLKEQEFNDIDMVLAYLEGKKITSHIEGEKVYNIKTCVKSLEQSFDDYQNDRTSSKKCNSEYFEIKYFQNGNVHMKFLSEEVRVKFNRAVSEIKGFVVPESTQGTHKKRKYNYQHAKV